MPIRPAVDWGQFARQTLPELLALWKVWGLLAGLAALRAAWWAYQQRRLARSGIVEIDRMDGRTFEQYLATAFRALGYDVAHTGRRGDFGADLVVVRGGVRTIVQAKRWSRNVGVKAVQEANAAPAMHRCSHAIVVTNRYFTEAARKLARANGVELWDRDVLVTKLLHARARDAVEAEPTTA